MSGYAAAANRGGSGTPVQAGENIPLAADIAGTPDVLVLAARSIAGTPTVRGSLQWRELY